MREFNERVVLQAIRLHAGLPKADIARLTRLTPQAVQTIAARLEADALVARLSPLRGGKVGQPSVPLALNADGAFGIGIHIGRRRADLLLLDFAGSVRQRLAFDYAFPEPAPLFDAIGAGLRQLQRSLPRALRGRVHGVGVAAPLTLHGWQSVLGVAPDVAARRGADWDDADIRTRVGALTRLQVDFVKDTTAACVAELFAGRGRSIANFVYLFVDTLIGGSVVLGSQLHGGPGGNAGAVGSLALGVATSRRGGRPPAQLLSKASLVTLERRFAAHGLDASAAVDARALQRPWLQQTRRWLHDAAAAIALAAHDAACLLDVDAFIVDGAFSRELLQAVLIGTEAALSRYDWEGVRRPALLGGTTGADARPIGAALLPLHAKFAPDRELFLKLGG